MEFCICKQCGENKELTTDNFTRGKNIRNGVNHFYWYKKCKICDSSRLKEKVLRYKSKNRKKIAEKQKEYHTSHLISDSQTKKDWYSKNKESVLKRVKCNFILRLKTDPVFRMKNSISASIRSCIKKNHQPLKKYLPYTLEELKQHLESLFEPWMNWDNYGVYRIESWNDDDSSTWTWQIDHIIAHSSFAYKSMSDQLFRDCWALSNLRPYSAKQNVIDGKRK